MSLGLAALACLVPLLTPRRQYNDAVGATAEAACGEGLRRKNQRQDNGAQRSNAQAGTADETH